MQFIQKQIEDIAAKSIFDFLRKLGNYEKSFERFQYANIDEQIDVVEELLEIIEEQTHTNIKDDELQNQYWQLQMQFLQVLGQLEILRHLLHNYKANVRAKIAKTNQTQTTNGQTNSGI